MVFEIGCQFKDSVEIEVEGKVLIVRPAQSPRSHWPQTFAKMAQHQDDKLLDEDAQPAIKWNRNEWRW